MPGDDGKPLPGGSGDIESNIKVKIEPGRIVHQPTTPLITDALSYSDFTIKSERREAPSKVTSAYGGAIPDKVPNNIPRLGNTTMFPSWKLEFLAVMRNNQLATVIEHPHAQAWEAFYNSATGTNDAVVLKSTYLSMHQLACSAIEQAAQKVLPNHAALHTTLSQYYRAEIEANHFILNNANLLWCYILAKFGQVSAEMVTNSYMEILNYKFNPKVAANQELGRLQSLIHNTETYLKSSGESDTKVPDVLVRTLVVNSLPEAYRPFVAILQSKQSYTLEELFTTLTTAENTFSLSRAGKTLAPTPAAATQANYAQDDTSGGDGKNQNHKNKKKKNKKASNNNEEPKLRSADVQSDTDTVNVINCVIVPSSTVGDQISEDVRRVLSTITTDPEHLRNSFILDSGATQHIVSNDSLVGDYKKLTTPIHVSGITGKLLLVKKSASCMLSANTKVNNILVVPQSKVNILAVSKFTAAGFTVTFTTNQAVITNKHKEPIAKFKHRDGLFYMDMSEEDSSDDEAPDFEIVQRKRTIPLKKGTESASDVARRDLETNRNKQKQGNNPPTTSANTSGSGNSSGNSSTGNTTGSGNANSSNSGSQRTTGSKSTNAPRKQMGTGNSGNNSRPTVAPPTSTAIHNALVAHAYTVTTVTPLPLLVGPSSKVTAKLWHERLGHATLSAQCAQRLGTGTRGNKPNDCTTCVLGKARRNKVGHSQPDYHNAAQPLDKLHLDLKGPMSHVADGSMVAMPSIDGDLYYLIVVDDKSRYKWVIPGTGKHAFAQALINLIVQLQTQYDRKVKAIHSDGGAEFVNNAIAQFCNQNGTVQTYTTPNSPFHNGIAERSIAVLDDLARSALIGADAPQHLWSEALLYVTYAYNRTPQKILQHQTPLEVLSGKSHSMDKLHVWGCDCWQVLRDKPRGTFDQVASDGMVFVGVTETQSAYRLLNPNNMEIVISRDVKWSENTFDHMRFVIKDSGIDYQDGMGTRYTYDHDDAGLSADPQYEPNSDQSSDSEHSDAGGVDDAIPPHDSTVASSPTTTPSTAPTDTYTERYEAKYGTHARDISQDIPTGDSDDALPNDFNQDSDTIAEHDMDDNSDMKSAPEAYAIGTSSGPHTHSQLTNASTSSDGYGGATSDDTGDTGANTSNTSTTQSTTKPRTFRRSARNKKSADHGPMVSHYVRAYSVSDDFHLVGATRELLVVPTTYRKAITSPQATEWTRAMDEEWSAIVSNGTFDLVEPPQGVKVVQSKWVYTVKYDANGVITRYKARLVAKGFTQTYGVDYFDIHSPTPRRESFKLVLMYAASHDTELYQLDFKNAFLQGELNEVIYMKQPEGYNTGDGRVLLVKKPLYGLKQAPLQWYHALTDYLLSIGYQRMISDPCIFYKFQPGHREPILLSVYVDDTTVAVPKALLVLWQGDKEALQQRFTLTDMGDLQWILKMEVKRDRANRKLTLSQSQYAIRMLEEYGLNGGASAPNPIPYDKALETVPAGDDALPLSPHDHHLYQRMIGSLQYYANLTRPDIQYVVSHLGRFVSRPLVHHLKLVKHVFKYVKGTVHYCLIFGSTQPLLTAPTLTAYSDANWAEPGTRDSTTGGIVLVNDNPLYWFSQKQAAKALSTCEAEYIAITMVTKELLALRNWLSELTPSIPLSVVVYCDNESAITVTHNEFISSQLRHIDLRYQYVRQLVQQGQLVVQWVATTQQLADCLTKRLGTPVFKQFRDHLVVDGSVTLADTIVQ